MSRAISPSATPEEAAAISAAINLFQAQTAPPPPAESTAMDPWLKAAYEEGVSAKVSFGPSPFFGEL
ncbi:MAG: hypothetical protein ACSLFI_05050 [Solirubrobacterales bacterium]